MFRRPGDSESDLALPISALVFLAFVVVGSAYIVVSKSYPGVFPTPAVTLVPVAVMVAYASVAYFVRAIRLRDDQTGDNLYYMGFLFTLTSLGMALYQFAPDDGAKHIVKNFGIAITSTIAGIALRVLFNQMRRDPIEVERAARLDLAEASRRVRQELDGTVREMDQFRRSSQQTLRDAYADIQADAEESAKQLTTQGERLSSSVSEIAKTLDELTGKLQAMPMPNEVIKGEMEPLTQGISEAVDTFGRQSESYASELQRVLKTLVDHQNEREESEGYLKVTVPTLIRTAEAMEALVGRLHELTVDLQGRKSRQRQPWWRKLRSRKRTRSDTPKVLQQNEKRIEERTL